MSQTCGGGYSQVSATHRHTARYTSDQMLVYIIRHNLKLTVVSCIITDVSTSLASVQQEIVDVHNAFRRAVEPTASNMLKMVNYLIFALLYKMIHLL